MAGAPRQSEDDYLRRVESLARAVVTAASDEEWFAFGDAGQVAVTPLERADRLGGLRFALLKPAGRISFEFKIPIGTLNGDVMTYGVIAAALSEGPRRYDELAAIPAIKPGSRGLA